MNKKLKNYRHGDIALIGIKELPKGLTEAKTKEIIKSSGGNSHSIDMGKIYFKDVNEYVFGYLEAKKTSLLHVEHGEKIGKEKVKVAKIEDGIYELRRQQEKKHEGMTAVQD